MEIYVPYQKEIAPEEENLLQTTADLMDTMRIVIAVLHMEV